MLPGSSSLVVASRGPPERWITGSGGTGFSGGSLGLNSCGSLAPEHRLSSCGTQV